MEARESAIVRPSAPRQRSQPQPIVSESALGMVSTRSFPAIVGTADMMLKSSSVRLVGYEKIGSGYCTAVVRGRIADVRIAVEEGAAVAEQFGQFISKSVISRPLANLEAVLPISGRLAKFVSERGYSRLSDLAVGLLETRGFPAMVGAADAMLKAGDVQLAAYEMVGDGLCTAIIRGRVSDVAIAIQAGMHEAERIGELHAVMVIPRPLDDLEETLPVASCWIEKPVPISIPLDIKEAHKELAEQEAVEQQQEQMQQPLQIPDLREIPVDRET
jgi:carbon dioxide concentrating mechanism protein CcmO